MSSDGSDSDSGPPSDRSEIRNHLSSMSFEQLLRMKEKLGSKLYDKKVFGTDDAEPKPKPKRANKNRPREISSKLRPRELKRQLAGDNIVTKPKTAAPRDPRFDPMCGEFDDKVFRRNYKFVGRIQGKERDRLRKELRECEDPEQRKTLKELIQRLDNKIRDRERKDTEEKKKYIEKEQIREQLRRGEKPTFKKKSVKKLESLIEKYEDLKQSNKLQKHIERRSKKLAAKERKNNTVVANE